MQAHIFGAVKVNLHRIFYLVKYQGKVLSYITFCGFLKFLGCHGI